MPAISAEELLKLSETDVTVPIAPEEYGPVLTQAPFINVEGTFNVRDIGKIPSSAGASSPIRPGYVFRSGMLSHLSSAGKATLANELGVRRIFDFRSRAEHAQGPDPQPSEDVTLVWLEATEETPNLSLEPFVEGYGEEGFVLTYLDVLKAYKPTITQLLEHVRDRPSEPFLFHCTAGRDRTGVVAGLIQTLAGVPRDTIALDYMLSRIGSEPVRKQLEAFARMGAGVTAPAADATPEEAKAAAAAVPPGFLNLINLRVVCWDAFLAALDTEHGGYEGYVTKVLGFSDADVAIIKKNLTAQ